MKCPIDNTLLSITERQGVEIDYCPQCRGVWLDRGELDKMIDKTEKAEPSRYAAPARPEESYEQRRDGGDNYKKKKRESFLGDLFDF